MTKTTRKLSHGISPQAQILKSGRPECKSRLKCSAQELGVYNVEWEKNVIMNRECVRIWNEEVVIHLKVLPQYSAGSS
jgi:hypothetical protein